MSKDWGPWKRGKSGGPEMGKEWGSWNGLLDNVCGKGTPGVGERVDTAL